jgi:hypothetical protein
MNNTIELRSSAARQQARDNSISLMLGFLSAAFPLTFMFHMNRQVKKQEERERRNMRIQQDRTLLRLRHELLD